MPLDFIGQQSLRYSNGQQIWFNGTYVTEGTTPKGSTWSRNPIPRNDIGGSGVGFAPPCLAYGLDASQCQGEGDGGTALVNFEIVDRIVIPAGTPPGAYVLGWRWSVISSSVCWSVMLATRLNARLIDCGGCAQGLRRKQPGLVILQRRHHRGQVVRVLLAHLQPRRALFVCMCVLYRFVQLLFCLLSGFISGFTVYQ